MVKKLHLLSDLFEEVYIPEAVFQEVVLSKSTNEYGKSELKKFIAEGTFQLWKIENSHLVHKLYGKLHQGELEVIVGAKELDIDIVAIDEKAARLLAKTFLLRPVGTVGILMIAKEKGIIKEIKPLLDRLIEFDFYISNSLYQHILERVGERN